MKALLALIVVLGVGGYFFQRHQQQSARNPEVIANPTYAELHMTLAARDRTFEQVLFAKTVDAADCEKYLRTSLEMLAKRSTPAAGPRWQVKSSECKADIAPRYAKLFDNQPGFVTYLSMARGDRTERDARLIYWGVSAQESDRICDGVATMQSSHKGAVACIRAAPL